MAPSAPASPDDAKRLRRYQIRTFALTWASYAGFYLTRKPIGVVKARLQDELGMTTAALGQLDTAYLAAYAAGQFINGTLGDRFGSRKMLTLGMLGTAACAALFGANSAALALIVIWAANGYFQSSGWPNNVKAMTPWFSSHGRGAIMGLWCTNYQVGGIVGTALAAFLIGAYGWRSAFFTPAVIVAGIGVTLFLFLRNHPRDVGLISPADAEAAEAPAQARAEGHPEASAAPPETEERMSFADALRLPGILNLGGAYFCLKLIRYTLLFWLPFYLNKRLGYAEDTAGYLSTTFEIGGIAGAIIIGFLSDRFAAGRRVLFAAPMVFGICLALGLFQLVGSWGMAFNAGAMALVGFMLFGPDSLLSGAAAQDLGGSRAAGSAAGVINGMGSVGAALQGLVIPFIVEDLGFGWQGAFYFLMVLAVVATGVLFPLFLKDLQKKSLPEAS